MTLEFRRDTALIGAGGAGQTGPFLVEQIVTFSGDVNTAEVALNGFQMHYANGNANRLYEVEADTDVADINGPDVHIRFQANVRDATGTDPYIGYLTAVVIADVS